MDKVPTLPPSYRLEYLAEGRANIVYRILSAAGERISSDICKGKLLRLRKEVPTSLPCLEAQEAWLRVIRPMFPVEELVDQRLVDLRGTQLIRRLNEELKMQESQPSSSRSRPLERSGVYLAADDFGLLVTDMTNRNETDTVFEFKPKWLQQSPCAPAGSRRCRQCAHDARRNSDRQSLKIRRLDTQCPLNLLTNNIQDAAQAVASRWGWDYNGQIFVSMITWLTNNKILARLAKYQKRLDRHGIFGADTDDHNFLVAMTLRDCSVFVRCSKDRQKGPEARIGDLDLKSDRKWEYWKANERILIEDRWYLGLEDWEHRQPIDCVLNPARQTRRRNSI